MTQFLALVLEAPLLSFGSESVDARGAVAEFPGASMLTGLLANALGWRRDERDRLDALQSRLSFAARIDRKGERFTEFQTVQLRKDDKGWTTLDRPEGRDGGAETYRSPYIRRRDFDADKRVTVVLTLDPPSPSPDLATLAGALATPARPLFLGRKSCLPSRPLFEAMLEADNLVEALRLVPAQDRGATRTLLPAVLRQDRDETLLVSDLRNWRTGVHGGQRAVAVRYEPGGSEP